jgi:hypothetical protein
MRITKPIEVREDQDMNMPSRVGLGIVVMRGEKTKGSVLENGEMAEDELLRRFASKKWKNWDIKSAIWNIAHLMQRVVKAAVLDQASPPLFSPSLSPH